MQRSGLKSRHKLERKASLANFSRRNPPSLRARKKLSLTSISMDQPDQFAVENALLQYGSITSPASPVPHSSAAVSPTVFSSCNSLVGEMAKFGWRVSESDEEEGDEAYDEMLSREYSSSPTKRGKLIGKGK